MVALYYDKVWSFKVRCKTTRSKFQKVRGVAHQNLSVYNQEAKLFTRSVRELVQEQLVAMHQASATEEARVPELLLP